MFPVTSCQEILMTSGRGANLKFPLKGQRGFQMYNNMKTIIIVRLTQSNSMCVFSPCKQSDHSTRYQM